MNQNNEMNRTFDIHEISPEALAVLGGGKLAYVRTIRSEDVQKHFPQAPELEPGALLYALHAADGTPIMRRTGSGIASASCSPRWSTSVVSAETKASRL